MTRRASLANVRWSEMLCMPVADLELMAKKRIHVVPTMEVMHLLYSHPTVLPQIHYLEHKRGWSMAFHDNLFHEARKRHILMGVGTDAILELADKNYPQMYVTE